MIIAIVAMIASLAAAQPRTLLELPRLCYSAPRHDPRGTRPPEDLRWQGPLLDTLSTYLNDSVDHTRELEALWRADSASVTWGMALLASNPDRASQTLAASAGAWYFSHSGRADPILIMLDDAGNPSYRWSALRAIRDKLTPTQGGIVFRYACDAGWLLSMLAIDSTYRRWAVGPAAETLRWPTFATATLRSAASLLDGERRDVVNRLLAKYGR